MFYTSKSFLSGAYIYRYETFPTPRQKGWRDSSTLYFSSQRRSRRDKGDSQPLSICELYSGAGNGTAEHNTHVVPSTQDPTQQSACDYGAWFLPPVSTEEEPKHTGCMEPGSLSVQSWLLLAAYIGSTVKPESGSFLFPQSESVP